MSVTEPTLVERHHQRVKWIEDPNTRFIRAQGIVGVGVTILIFTASLTGGGIAPDGKSWIPCRSGFFLPVRVLSRMFRGLFLHHMEKAFLGGSPHQSTDGQQKPGKKG